MNPSMAFARKTALAYGAQSIAFTYNDPVIFAEYAIDTALACHERGIRNVAVTAGYIHPAPRQEFFAVMDAANNTYATNAQFDSRVTGLLRQVATRRFNMKLDEAAARDREDFLGKLKMANANEVVDLFGNAVTTLMNQVSARGTYSGTERDVTDWDSILA